MSGNQPVSAGGNGLSSLLLYMINASPGLKCVYAHPHPNPLPRERGETIAVADESDREA